MRIFDRVYLYGADRDRLPGLQFDILSFSWKLGERGGKEWFPLLFLKHGRQIVKAVDEYTVAWYIGGHKERKALDVVPVGVTDKEVQCALTAAARSF